MRFIPHDKFTLVSSLSPAMLTERLRAQVGPRKLIIFSWQFGKVPANQYRGDITDTGFKVSPAITYRNSFNPVIVGAYETYLSGTKIRVTQRLQVFVGLFLLLWVGILTAVFGGVVLTGEKIKIEVAGPHPYFYLGFLLFVWALSTGFFWFEARHTKKRLSALLEARIADDF